MDKIYYVALTEDQAAKLGVGPLDEIIYCFLVADVAGQYDDWCSEQDNNHTWDDLTPEQQDGIVHEAEHALENYMGDWTKAMSETFWASTPEEEDKND